LRIHGAVKAVQLVRRLPKDGIARSSPHRSASQPRSLKMCTRLQPEGKHYELKSSPAYYTVNRLAAFIDGPSHSSMSVSFTESRESILIT
jgi:hypothetical protein